MASSGSWAALPLRGARHTAGQIACPAANAPWDPSSSYSSASGSEGPSPGGCAAWQGARRGHRASGAIVRSPRRESRREPRRPARGAGSPRGGPVTLSQRPLTLAAARMGFGRVCARSTTSQRPRRAQGRRVAVAHGPGRTSRHPRGRSALLASVRGGRPSHGRRIAGGLRRVWRAARGNCLRPLGCAAGVVRGPPQRPRQGDRQHAQRRHGPKPLRPHAGVEQAGE
jgi:hypothetical protein